MTDRKIYTCFNSHDRDALVVRPSANDDGVVFKSGSYTSEGSRDPVSGLDVYLDREDVDALIAQLEEWANGQDEPEVITFKETFECAYSGASAKVGFEHTATGILPNFSTEDNDVYVDEAELLRLRDLIDLSLDKIEDAKNE